MFFAQLQIFRSTFANGEKWDYCFEFSFQKFSSQINSTTDFYILCKKGWTIFRKKILVSQYRKIRRGTLPGFRKILVSKLFMHKRGGVISRLSVVKIRLKNVGKGWNSNPYLPLQNPLSLPTVPWEPFELLTNFSEIIKIFDTTESRTRTSRFRTLLS